MSNKLEFIPREKDWCSYTAHEKLINFIWQSLKLKEKNEGDWQYMNFYSESSIWELVIKDDFVASVSLETKENNEVEEVVQLSLSFRDESALEFSQVTCLLNSLKNDFDLEIN